MASTTYKSFMSIETSAEIDWAVTHALQEGSLFQSCLKHCFKRLIGLLPRRSGMVFMPLTVDVGLCVGVRKRGKWGERRGDEDKVRSRRGIV